MRSGCSGNSSISWGILLRLQISKIKFSHAYQGRTFLWIVTPSASTNWLNSLGAQPRESWPARFNFGVGVLRTGTVGASTVVKLISIKGKITMCKLNLLTIVTTGLILMNAAVALAGKKIIRMNLTDAAGIGEEVGTVTLEECGSFPVMVAA